MTNKEIIQISKSKPKKFSILCTFNHPYIYILFFLYAAMLQYAYHSTCIIFTTGINKLQLWSITSFRIVHMYTTIWPC
jgi:hypothetical protein